ncbi:hypothetical protein LSTR_LSTR013675 [Laodelphax striatellus]|uniref:Uncharacterized protein n=1 Tax=Laodelphax striatellus TaxID=195883 RepID=A0A482XL66_LAOST|nr:hypothetical protein LSTR_LSTR013675 [Laodelphax striatellus]
MKATFFLAAAVFGVALATPLVDEPLLETIHGKTIPVFEMKIPHLGDASLLHKLESSDPGLAHAMKGCSPNCYRTIIDGPLKLIMKAGPNDKAELVLIKDGLKSIKSYPQIKSLLELLNKPVMMVYSKQNFPAEIYPGLIEAKSPELTKEWMAMLEDAPIVTLIEEKEFIDTKVSQTSRHVADFKLTEDNIVKIKDHTAVPPTILRYASPAWSYAPAAIPFTEAAAEVLAASPAGSLSHAALVAAAAPPAGAWAPAPLAYSPAPAYAPAPIYASAPAPVYSLLYIKKGVCKFRVDIASRSFVCAFRRQKACTLPYGGRASGTWPC